MHGSDAYSGKSKSLIWNPTIRKSVDIDVCSIIIQEYLTFGFGVCPDTFDPMIVKIDYYSLEGETIYEVFTLSTNAWRRISKNLPRECLSLTNNQVAIDRFMYWIAEEEIYMDVRNQSRHKRNLIVSFDMRSEEFTEVTLPASLIVFPESSLYLYKIMDSLVVVQLKYEAENRVDSVWKMMEHGVSKSFTKLYTIDTTDVIQHVLGFRKSGEPIIETENNSEKDLFAYDPSSKQVDDIWVFRTQKFCSVTSYIETLLLLDQ